MENGEWAPFSILHSPFSQSQRAEARHLERGNGPHHAGGAWQFSRHDPAGFHGGTERTTSYLGAEWIQERIARANHTSRDHDRVRVDHVQERREARSEISGGVAHDF